MHNQFNTVRFWRRDLSSSIGAILIGTAFIAVQQATGRIDLALDPSLQLVNGTTWAMFTGLICLLFRQPAGILAGEVQALISLVTGLSPLAPYFFFANGLGSLAYSISASFLDMHTWIGHAIAQAACNIVGNVCLVFGLTAIFGMPFMAALASAAITAAFCTVFSTILTKAIAGRLEKYIYRKERAEAK